MATFSFFLSLPPSTPDLLGAEVVTPCSSGPFNCCFNCFFLSFFFVPISTGS
uniref:Uncharacterized protein n=1 Tax=Arundo donax TaxID=35708 RepID=A0A0A8YNN4_ARUDO